MLVIDPPACRELAFYLCYRIFVRGGVLDAPPGAAQKVMQCFKQK